MKSAHPYGGRHAKRDLHKSAAIVASYTTEPALWTCLAAAAGLPRSLVSRFISEPDQAAFSVLCKALGLSRQDFEMIALRNVAAMSRHAEPRYDLFERIDRKKAATVVGLWRREEKRRTPLTQMPPVGRRGRTRKTRTDLRVATKR
jgi:hypothetical protein